MWLEISVCWAPLPTREKSPRHIARIVRTMIGGQERVWSPGTSPLLGHDEGNPNYICRRKAFVWRYGSANHRNAGEEQLASPAYSVRRDVPRGELAYAPNQPRKIRVDSGLAGGLRASTR